MIHSWLFWLFSLPNVACVPVNAVQQEDLAPPHTAARSSELNRMARLLDGVSKGATRAVVSAADQVSSLA